MFLVAMGTTEHLKESMTVQIRALSGPVVYKFSLCLNVLKCTILTGNIFKIY